jgi:proline-specific peptidase
VNVTDGLMPYADGTTWFRVTGTDTSRAPLVALHGGPGATHDYLLPLTALAGDRRVIHYDQFGVGRSSRRPEWDPSAYTMDFFIDELCALVDHLDLDGGFHLLGHSWGGMLAVEYALRGPGALRSLTLTDTVASSDLIIESINDRFDAIRAEVGDEDKVVELFGERHMCRVPTPDELAYTFAQLAENPVVHDALNGTESHEIGGTLRRWTSIDRLGGLDLPTLVLAGEFDELSAIAWQPFVDLIPGARLHVFAGASHVPFIETPAEYLEVLGRFLAEADLAAPAADLATPAAD